MDNHRCDALGALSDDERWGASDPLAALRSAVDGLNARRKALFEQSDALAAKSRVACARGYVLSLASAHSRARRAGRG